MEPSDFLTTQLVTYLGNKRSLLGQIETQINRVRQELGKDRLLCADLFSGSGAVARLLKEHSSHLIVSDLEDYCRVLNTCYLSNREDFPEEEYGRWRTVLDRALMRPEPGYFARNYAPRDDAHIRRGERVFFTRDNACVLDTACRVIGQMPEELRPWFLGPLIVEASVHNNTGGIFKGFYKDRNTGIGHFGGAQEAALSRILGPITVPRPVLSQNSCPVEICQGDANALAGEMPLRDLTYLDPPYNQHPYGSNYFMLNLLVNGPARCPVSRVSGIPRDWNRSQYNRRAHAAETFRALAESCNSRYLLVSYNSEGFISRAEMEDILSAVGEVRVTEIPYPTYRASRNLKNRSTQVREMLFLVKKQEKMKLAKKKP